MNDETTIEQFTAAAQERVQGAYQRATDLQVAMLSGARIAGNVVFWPDERGAA